MLYYEGYTTERLSPDIPAINIQNSLNSLPSITTFGSVNVTLEDANNTVRGYRVKFVSDQPQSTSMLQDASDLRGQFVTVVTDKAGISSDKGFSITLGGAKSGPIHPNSTQEELTKVVKDLFTTQCTFSEKMSE